MPVLSAAGLTYFRNIACPHRDFRPRWCREGENPVFSLTVGAGFPPERERLRQDGMDWHRFLRRLGLAFTHDTVGVARITFIVP